jgi:hypothetical protein
MHDIIFLATLLSGLMAGIALDKWVVQLPARKKIGAKAFAEYFRASDLGPGIYLYPIIGLAAPMLTILAAVLDFATGTGTTHFIHIAALFAVGHLIATSQAAPTGLKLRRNPDEPERTRVLDTFSKWNAIRAVCLFFMFLLSLAALFSINS